MTESDADIIRRWRSGDESAFGELVRRWEPAVGRFLSRLAPESEVADLRQELFLRVFRAGPKYRENGHFSTWMFQIALNLARDSARRRRPVDSLNGHAPVSAPDLTTRPSEHMELSVLVARAVAELPQALREVIAWRNDAGISFEEMARQLGVPASTLKSRYSTALLQLRQRLQEWGYAPEGEL
jgi:RNA polymerase sigma-70 factor (ECF subfamily)